jgi:hypothetical protein
MAKLVTRDHLADGQPTATYPRSPQVHDGNRGGKR